MYIRRLGAKMERGPAQRNGRAGPLGGINCPKSGVRRGTAVDRFPSDRSSTSHNPLCTTAVASPRATLFRWFTLSDGAFFNTCTRHRQPPDLRVCPVTRRARGRLRQTVAAMPQRCHLHRPSTAQRRDFVRPRGGRQFDLRCDVDVDVGEGMAACSPWRPSRPGLVGVDERASGTAYSGRRHQSLEVGSVMRPKRRLD
jgi:hypothetical protein